MLSFLRQRFYHEWKLKELAFREYARKENAQRYNRQRGFIINPYAFGGGGPTDPDFASVVSLLHFDGVTATAVFTDQIPARTWTQMSGATLDGAQAKWGPTSFFTNTASQGISCPDHADWEFGSGNFTVEEWIRCSGLPASFAYVFQKAASGVFTPWDCYVTAGAEIGFQSSTSGAAHEVNIASSGLGFSTNVWMHIRYQRNGNLFSGIVDGVSVASATVAGTLFDNTDPVTIGCNASGTSASSFHGYHDDFRATKGVARGLTVPTAAFPDA